MNPWLTLQWNNQKVIGVKQFHENSIIHRDLTPGNVLISEDNLVKISDLGLADKGEDDNVYDYKLKYGTHIYKPKEFYIGFYGLGSDLYSLGVIGAQLFCIFPLTEDFVNNVCDNQKEICKLLLKLVSDKIKLRGSCEYALEIVESLLISKETLELENFFSSLTND